MNKSFNILLLLTEFLLLFIGIPVFMYMDTRFSIPSMVLIPSLVFIFLILRYKTDFRWKELIRFKISKTRLKHDAITVIVLAILLLFCTIIWIPDKLFNLPKGNPYIWIALSFFYPVFSAWPQEIIFRTFIFRRYNRIFGNDWGLILASGITFSFAHIVYYHPVSLILTFMLGLYMGKVYRDTGSVLYTAILHGIMGILVFTVGMGEFFWLEMGEYL